MRFGTYFFLQATPGRTSAQVIQAEMEQMVRSEALGFDSVWLTEHHYSDYGLSAAPSVLAATLASRTDRITIGTAVYVLPFHHPLRLAEETATLDILSGGRLVVGIGRGNRAREFVGHGVSQDESRTRLEEGVALLLAAWTQPTVTFNGQHWSVPGLSVDPKPLQSPHPPLAVAASSDQSVAWTARHGWRLLSSGLGTPLPALVSLRQMYADGLTAAAHPSSLLDDLLRHWTVTKHVYVADTDAQARADAEMHERWYLDSFARSLSADGLPGLSDTARRQALAMAERVTNRRWEDLIEDSLLIGSPDTVRAKVAELAEAGVGELACWMNFGGLPLEQVERSMSLFATEVIPAFRPLTV
ncbi:MAG TPA: LLM class flavin-dependent oxidoreductase [Chloroflexota bacterium]|jgi:alkanesulfonate monooxygenase SsuD/methylene tetrahydromethanopterin reductase-like flavin-dependent oxidoreductase (luciferase family)|nr:LLM class flavin-dependent oxidoreductase [Chloroflexota bacterium]